jgi:hypothetical protein
MVHLFHGQNNRIKRDDLMSSLIKCRKFKILDDHDIEPDTFCDYNFIFGDLNYRLNSSYDHMINSGDINIAHTFVNKK